MKVSSYSDKYLQIESTFPILTHKNIYNVNPDWSKIISACLILFLDKFLHVKKVGGKLSSGLRKI